VTNDSIREKRPPLDPSLLPSVTQGRFRMLTLAALHLAWGLGGALVEVPNVFRLQAPPEVQRFLHQMASAENFDITELRNLAPTLKSSKEIQEIQKNLERSLLRFTVAAFFLLLLLGLATFLLLAIPHFYRQQYASPRLTNTQNPKVLGALRLHALTPGLRQIPTFCRKPPR